MRWPRARALTPPVLSARLSQFHFDPSTYAELIATEVPAYDELHERLAAATEGLEVERALDLGAGTGRTSRAVRTRHPASAIVAVDENPGMLERIELGQVERRVGRLQDPLPAGPFDLIVSALAVHHLDRAEKQQLFARVHDALRSGGRFVLADVVTTDVQVAPLSDGYDKPDPADVQLRWLREAGFEAELLWEQDDLALLQADRG
jgi:tRNA (cmo5U34)-methyltransferase